MDVLGRSALGIDGNILRIVVERSDSLYSRAIYVEFIAAIFIIYEVAVFRRNENVVRRINVIGFFPILRNDFFRWCVAF